MLKTIACLSLGAALAMPAFPAAPQTGYGASNTAPSTSTFDRAWNHANESKDRARAGAAYVRHHDGRRHYHHHPYDH